MAPSSPSSDGTITYDSTNRKWLIETRPDIAIRLQRIFEQLSKNVSKILKLSDNPVNCRELHWCLARYRFLISEGDRARLERGAGVHIAREANVQRMLSGDYVARALPLLLPLRDYQSATVEMALTTGSILCCDEMGLGKTGVGIGVIADRNARPALIVCPTHLPSHWIEQINKFLPGMRIHVLKSVKPYDLTKGKRGKAEPFPDVILCGYAKFPSWALHLGEHVKTVIYDEAHALRHAVDRKGHLMRRYSAALHLRDRTAYRVGLTGTPIYNRGPEIRNVINALEPDALGSNEEFGRQWCDGQTGPKALVKDPRALGSYLYNAGLMVRRTREDVGRVLPPLSKIVHPIETDEKAFSKMSSVLEELARRILAYGTEAEERLRVSGELDWRLREATGVAKAPYVAEFVQILVESDLKVVLFGWHHAVYSIWLEKLAQYSPAFYTGEQTTKQKDLSRHRFLHEERCRILIMSNRAGEGVDGLQNVSSTVVLGELDWSPAIIDQNIARVARDGQTKPVFAHIPLTNSGSDPAIADVLGIKRAQATGIVAPQDEAVHPLAGDSSAHAVKLARAFLEKHNPKLLVRLDAERTERLRKLAAEKEARRQAARAGALLA